MPLRAWGIDEAMQPSRLTAPAARARFSTSTWVAGVIVALTGHPVVTGWAGGTLRAFRSVNPSTALYFDVLRHALEHGHTAVDLVGYVDEGISRFKMSLGAVERPFTTVVSSPLPPVVRTAVLALRRRATVHG